MATLSGLWWFDKETIDVSETFSHDVEWTSHWSKTAEGYQLLTGTSIQVVYQSGKGNTLEFYNGSSRSFYAYTQNNGYNYGYYSYIRIIDFGTSQTVSDDFYTWLVANATPLDEGAIRTITIKTPSQDIKPFLFEAHPFNETKHYRMYPNSVQTIGDGAVYTFEYLSAKCKYVTRPVLTSGTTTVYNMAINGEQVEYVADTTLALSNLHTIADNTEFTVLDSVYSTDDTGRYGFVFGEPEEPTTATVITYNGETIASLEAGQSATLSCQGKKMVSDLAVAFGANGSITYNGTETAVESGKTATLACSGKKMKTDIVISAT